MLSPGKEDEAGKRDAQREISCSTDAECIMFSIQMILSMNLRRKLDSSQRKGKTVIAELESFAGDDLFEVVILLSYQFVGHGPADQRGSRRHCRDGVAEYPFHFDWHLTCKT